MLRTLGRIRISVKMYNLDNFMVFMATRTENY